MRLSISETALLVIATIMISLTSATKSKFIWTDISPFADVFSFEINFSDDIIGSLGFNDIRINTKFHGIQVTSQQAYGYGVFECESISFKTVQLVGVISLEDSGVALLDFKNISLAPPSDLCLQVTSIKFFGTFNAKVKDIDQTRSSGSISNNDSTISEWSSTYPKFHRELATSLNFTATSKIDPAGRDYQVFKLILDGVNLDLTIGHGLGLGSFALIEASPNQPGQQITPGRFALVDSKSPAGCIVEESGQEVFVSLSPWDESSNVLSFDKNFFYTTHLSKFTLSCSNLGFYPPQPQASVSTQTKEFQRLQKQIDSNGKSTKDKSTPTILRLLGITTDNERYVIDKWN